MVLRPVVAAFALVALVLLGTAACGTAADEARVGARVRHVVDAVPGMSIELPEPWTIAENAAALSPAERDAIARENLALTPLLDPDVYDALLSEAFLAIGQGGLISIMAAEVPPGITLDEVIEANLLGLEAIPGCVVEGDPREIVEQPCGATWNLRWRLPVDYMGEGLEIHNHEHVFLHSGRVVLVNLSTVGGPADVALTELFEDSTRSIRLAQDMTLLEMR